MTYLLNIGNTHTQVAWAADTEPRLIHIYKTPELLATGRIPCLDHDASDWNALASSVVPVLSRRLGKTYGERVRFISWRDFPHIDFSLVNTDTLGVDRICNAAAALALAGGGPVAVFDFGTCIASEGLDGKGRFCGGAIAPGRQLMRNALHEHTAQLPLVPISSDWPSPLGANTADAIRAGIDMGAIGLARQLIAETRAVLCASATQAACAIFATGGDAPFFLAHLPELTPAPGRLTLRGIQTVM